MLYNLYVFEQMKKEFELFKLKNNPIHTQYDNQLLSNLYVRLKNLDLVNFLIERWKYGFDIECDIATLLQTKIDLPINEKTLLHDTTSTNTEPTSFSQSINVQIKQPTIHEKLQFLTQDKIQTYTTLTNKDTIEYEDIISLKQMNIIS